MMKNDDLDSQMEPIQIEIDGTLDLHHFSPKDLKSLLPEYVEACIEKEIYHLRIVHGKGKGQLRRSVHAILGRIRSVESYRLAGIDGGSWGATLVILKKNL
jgi:DNA-nicking Smr family endonuclease